MRTIATVTAATPSDSTCVMGTRLIASYPGSDARARPRPRTTVTRSRRCVSTWSWCATGVSSSAVPMRSAASASGSSQRPPNSPPAGRRPRTIAPASSIHTCVRASTGSSSCALRRATTGNSSWRPSRLAAHHVAIGHTRQRGEDGVQIVAPSSIRPWLRSPGAAACGSAVISSPARRHSAFDPRVDLMSSSSANTRASTRATLPSTSGARSPYAIEAIAPAVYGPMPGTPRNALAVRGSASRTDCAPAHRLRARE